MSNSIYSDTAWMDSALCAGSDPSLFHPADREGKGYGTGNRERYKEARKLCARCPVAAECASWGADSRFGIWAGKDDHGRRPDRAKQPRKCQRCNTEIEDRRRTYCDECRPIAEREAQRARRAARDRRRRAA